MVCILHVDLATKKAGSYTTRFGLPCYFNSMTIEDSNPKIMISVFTTYSTSLFRIRMRLKDKFHFQQRVLQSIM